MKPVIIILIIITVTLTSCYKVYDPKVESNNKVIIVNGLMTNKPESYHIILTYANSLNSTEKELPLEDANVYVTDNMDNHFIFHEWESGNYASDSLQFTGIPGQSYRLHIVTADGKEYESDPQRLFPEVSPDSIYAEFGSQEILERSTGLKVITSGANIFIDIRNLSDSIPRYRFTSNLVKQYYYTLSFLLNWYTLLVFDYYCWQTVDTDPNINLSGVEYSTSSASVRKHPAGFADDNLFVFASYYGLKINMDDTTGIAFKTNAEKLFETHGRILYLNQYTLNNETYEYYKKLDEQMKSEGKLFDPIATQLNGNVKCITNSEKKAIGFFEASSVSYNAYVVDFRNLKNSQPALIKTPYILPPELDGCRINRAGSLHQSHNIPSFWIYIH